MRLEFDRGTILLKDAPANLDHVRLPGVLWDERVGVFRAPAHRYGALLKSLQESNVAFVDGASSSLRPPGEWGAIDLRPYQEASLRAWEIASRRGIVVLPTGGGKTRVAMAAIARCQVPALCLVPTRVLLEQWHHELTRHYSAKVGIFGDGAHELAPLTVATYESAYRNIGRLGKHFGLLVVDEVHHFGLGLRNEILELSTAPLRLGLTATLPKNGDQIESLRDLIGPNVFELGIPDLSGTYLADFDCYTLQLELTPPERRSYETNMATFRNFHAKFRKSCPEASWTDFARFAARSIEGRNAMAGLRCARRIIHFTEAKAATLRSLLARHRDKKTLIFTADTETAYTIAREFLVMPLTAEIKRKEREEALLHFREGRWNALVSCRVLNEGLDVPEAEVGIVVGGAFGEREHIQRVGRLLRPAEGKKAVIYELICRNTMEIGQWKKRSESFDTREPA